MFFIYVLLIVYSVYFFQLYILEFIVLNSRYRIIFFNLQYYIQFPVTTVRLNLVHNCINLFKYLVSYNYLNPLLWSNNLCVRIVYSILCITILFFSTRCSRKNKYWNTFNVDIKFINHGWSLQFGKKIRSAIYKKKKKLQIRLYNWYLLLINKPRWILSSIRLKYIWKPKYYQDVMVISTVD